MAENLLDSSYCNDADYLNSSYEILKHYFNQTNIHTLHHTSSFQVFTDEIIPYIVNGRHQLDEKTFDDKIKRNYVEFSNLAIMPPYIDTEKRLMYPLDAIKMKLNYFSKITATIEQYEEIIDINTGKKTNTLIGKEENVPFGKIPIPVKSKYCNITTNPENEKLYCPWDHGGYFIVNGSERVVLSIESTVPRKPMVSIDKGQNFNSFYVKVESRPDTQIVGNFQKFALKIKKDGSIVLAVLYFREISVFVLLRALGLDTDEDIINAVVNQKANEEIYNQLKTSISVNNTGYIDREEAIRLMINAMRTNKTYSESNKELREQQRRKHLMTVFKMILLPHISSDTGVESADFRCKAYFIGYMIRRLLKQYVKKSVNGKPLTGDDRDSLFNKRIETPGLMLGILFEQSFKKLIGDCSLTFQRKNTDDNKTPFIVSCIKSNQIEQTLRQALSKGNFGAPHRNGASHTLTRHNYSHSLSYMKRVLFYLPESSSKLTGPRHLHSTQYGAFCLFETPEGQKTGIVKNMACSTTITPGTVSQIPIIKDILKNFIIPLSNPKCSDKLYVYVRVFLNYNWLGLVVDAVKMHERLRKMRFNGEIDRTVSLVLNYDEKEYHIFTDNGRLIRPFFTVTNNALNFKYDMVKGIKSWSDIIEKYPNIIEMVAKDEEMFMMLATFPTQLEKAKKMMDKPLITDKRTITKINMTSRYDEVFVRYTHCEIHPSMILGIVSLNAPFINHNQGVRGAYNFSQEKACKGRVSYRTDLIYNGYDLYDTQLPLVTSRGVKFSNAHIFPAGINVIVAVCSMGFNQHDSILQNKSAVEIGLFRSAVHKKYEEKITRLQTASQTGLFMKPDDKVSGIKQDVNYEKITESGYPKKNTYLEMGDVIIGKCVPKPVSGNDNKTLKDSSIVYKSYIKGRVDNIVLGATSDDYPFLKLGIVQERTPIVGDKFACYDNETEVLTHRGFVLFRNLTEHDMVGILSGKHIAFEKPEEIQIYSYNSTMYHGVNDDIDVKITPNHNMFVSDGGKFALKPVISLNKNDRFHKIAATVSNKFVIEKIIKYLNVFNVKYDDMKYFIMFLGLVLFHGTQLNSVEILINVIDCTALTKITDLIDLFEIKSFREDKSVVIIDDRVAQLFNENNQKYPDIIKYFGRNELRHFAEGIAINVRKTNNDMIFHSEYKAELMQYIFVLIGTATYYYIAFNNTCILKINESKYTTLESYKKVQYSGYVYCCTVSSGILCVRRNGKVMYCGNSRHAQKGTVGILTRRTNIPYTEKGIIPHVVINPNCIPKRMTIGQLIETYLGKICVLKGTTGDATQYMGINIDKINEDLKSLGYEDYGNETMYNPITGEKIKSKIFIGPTYYRRLKQLAADKMHARLNGRMTILVRQPTEGRSKEGGLRIGEMERDAICAHGLSGFLKEAMVDKSDIYEVYVCDICGDFAHRIPKKNYYACIPCNSTRTTRLSIPYAFKLLIQELHALGINAKIKTNNSV